MTDPSEIMHATIVQIGKRVVDLTSPEIVDHMIKDLVFSAWTARGYTVLRVDPFHSAPSYVNYDGSLGSNGTLGAEDDYQAMQILVGVWVAP
jgi:hypothetical protein